MEKILFEECWVKLHRAASYFYMQHLAEALMVKIIKERHIIFPAPLCLSASNAVTSATTSSSTATSVPMMLPQPSTSKRRRQTVKVKREARPVYQCPECHKECKYPEDISNHCENTVQCELCLDWYHWDCVAFNGCDKWLCHICPEHYFL